MRIKTTVKKAGANKSASWTVLAELLPDVGKNELKILVASILTNLANTLPAQSAKNTTAALARLTIIRAIGRPTIRLISTSGVMRS